MFDAIAAFVETVWPRLFVCLLFGFGTAFISLIFDIAWWKRFLISFGIFTCWFVLGVLLEIFHSVSKRKEERSKHLPKEPASH